VNRALITGGAGFIGLALARRLLRDGWRVDLLDDFSRGRRDSDVDELARAGGVSIVEGNLCDPSVGGGIDDDYTEIFHFAAIVGVQNVVGRPFDVLDGNVALTSAAIRLALRQKRLRRFVFASTSEVYAGTLEHFELPLPTPESAPLALPPLDRPRTSYMLSKIFGEAMCLHSGLPVTIIRPHNIYGPRMGLQHVVPQLLERGHRTPEPGLLEVFSVDHTRTFCFIDDAVEMIARLATAPAAVGKTVNVGTQAPEISIGRLAEIVIATLNKRLTVAPKPPTPGSPARRVPDLSLCAALTGFRSRIAVEEGVKRTYAWYRERVFAA
jgi:nucleoside-diphosphate-sugar epimerase